MKKTSFQEQYALPITILNLLCMATVYISMNKILVGICGIIVTFVLSASFIKIIKNKSVDNKTKTSSYIILVVIASIIAVTILKTTTNFQ
ncbi:hypothetical protein [Flavobacterium sp.]|uniref:hypothetical protein n=1 Tax=Flavobacterium sp. TaxID=239 RepID=UPI0031DFA798